MITNLSYSIAGSFCLAVLVLTSMALWYSHALRYKKCYTLMEMYMYYNNCMEHNSNNSSYSSWILFCSCVLIVTNHKVRPSRLTAASSINQLDDCAVDNIIIKCVSDEPSDDRADNYPISSHHQVVGRRRRAVTTSSTCKCYLWHHVLSG